ncbi:hypothetical protein MD484_g6921, partial [Candolleomyces efflorescens]
MSRATQPLHHGVYPSKRWTINIAAVDWPTTITILLAAAAAPKPQFKTIPSTDRNIFLHGRWDKNTGSWWAGTGFKLNVVNLRHLSINLGEYTTQPFAATAISIDGGAYFTANFSTGTNIIPLRVKNKGNKATTLVEINVQGWQNNRIQFRNITLNADAKLVEYKPKKRVIQFVGDSLSAGQFLPLGVNQAWPFLVAQKLKAEAKINAQPGATFTDMESYGNVHGVSYQFFKTEDTGYIWQTDHNYTTPWPVRLENPKTTDLVIHIGANDASHGVPQDQFIDVYLTFLDKLRKEVGSHLENVYVLTPFGWPHEGDVVDYYYDGVYAKIVEEWYVLHPSTHLPNPSLPSTTGIFLALRANTVHSHIRNRNRRTSKTGSTLRTHLVDCTGWIKFADVFPDNVHPNVQGMQNIADKFVQAWVG